MRILLIALCFQFIILSAHAQNLISGRADVPKDVLPRVAGTTINSMFGPSLGQIEKDGRFTLPVSMTGDVDMLFVKNPISNEIVMLGYGYDDVANIGVEGTALAMLMMFNPVNGMQDKNAKKALLQAYQNNPSFPRLTELVKHTISNMGNVTTPSDQALVRLIADIQNSTPQAQQKSAMYDPMQLMAY